jgi:nitrite reductase/ring-hydroxylating ferredoxin subunit
MDWVKIIETQAMAESALPENIPRLLIVRGQRICLVRREGKLFAVQDKCTHNGESLSKGHLNYLGEVVCPLHQYQFNLKTGRECSQRSNDLDCYPVKENEEGVFILL